jgi:hypothetical protein
MRDGRSPAFGVPGRSGTLPPNIEEAPGEGMPRRFNSPAIQRGDLPSANHWKIRRTVSACSG